MVLDVQEDDLEMCCTGHGDVGVQTDAVRAQG